MKWYLTIMLTILSCISIFAQKNVIDSILVERKKFNIQKASDLISTLEENNQLKKLFQVDIEMQKKGVSSKEEIILPDDFTSLKEEIIAYYLYADALRIKETKKEFIIYEHYIKSLNLALKHKDTFLINIILPKIQYHLYRNGKELKSFEKYLHTAKQHAQDTVDFFNYYYYKLGYEMLAIDILKKHTDTLALTSLAEKGITYSPTPYFKAQMNKQVGILYDAFLNQPYKALKYYNLALKNYKKDSLFYSANEIISIIFNKAIISHNIGDYKESIRVFDSILPLEKKKIFQMYGKEWLYKNYDSLYKNTSSPYYAENALKYIKEAHSIKDELDPVTHALRIKDFENGNDIEKTERRLNKVLLEQNEILTSNYLLIGLVGGLTLILFFLYKLSSKNKNKNDQLLKEKESTLRAIEDLKKIVIKDYIVLKDGTKVYISELLYIKSDDHYLKVFLSNGDFNFVRGKISQINEELPPNFKRCHRSYIINENYISKINKNKTVAILKDNTKIPISNSFRSNFNNY